MTIDFWFELSSPYSYISAMRIPSLEKKHGVKFSWHPFLLGPFFKTQGWNTTPFNIQKEKGDYMWVDVARRCKKFNIPFSRPDVFPVNSVYAARVILAAAQESEELAVKTTLFLYKLYFQENKDIGNKDLLSQCLESNGMGHLSEAIHSPEMKERLKKATDQSNQLNVFGAPMFFCDGEKYWGDDRLEDLLADINS